MSAAPLKVLFIDRDGTLVEEPDDEQVDSLAKIRFVPGVFASLQQLLRAGYRLVMVTNQDGLGTASFPQQDFEIPQQFMVDAFASQGIHFDAVCICPHKPADGCDCRKPSVRIVEDYLRDQVIDTAQSAVIGDRDTDLTFAANLGIRGLRLRLNGAESETWPAITRELLARRATVQRRTKETDITVQVDLDAEGPIEISTGHGFFDHMVEQLAKHGGFSMRLNCKGDLHIDLICGRACCCCAAPLPSSSSSDASDNSALRLYRRPYDSALPKPCDVCCITGTWTTPAIHSPEL